MDMSSFAAISGITIVVSVTVGLVAFFLFHLCYWCISDDEDVHEKNGEAIEMKILDKDVCMEPEIPDKSDNKGHKGIFRRRSYHYS